MSEVHREAARARYRRESEVLCPHCRGRVTGSTTTERSRRGGNSSYIHSLQPGAPSMSDRGKKGGRPRALTLQDLDAGKT